MKKNNKIVVKIIMASVLVTMVFINSCKKDLPTVVLTIIEHDVSKVLGIKNLT